MIAMLSWVSVSLPRRRQVPGDELHFPTESPENTASSRVNHFPAGNLHLSSSHAASQPSDADQAILRGGEIPAGKKDA